MTNGQFDMCYEGASSHKKRFNKCKGIHEPKGRVKGFRVELRPSSSQTKIWVGTFSTRHKAMRAFDAAVYLTGKDTHYFRYPKGYFPERHSKKLSKDTIVREAKKYAERTDPLRKNSDSPIGLDTQKFESGLNYTSLTGQVITKNVKAVDLVGTTMVGPQKLLTADQLAELDDVLKDLPDQAKLFDPTEDATPYWYHDIQVDEAKVFVPKVDEAKGLDLEVSEIELDYDELAGAKVDVGDSATSQSGLNAQNPWVFNEFPLPETLEVYSYILPPEIEQFSFHVDFKSNANSTRKSAELVEEAVDIKDATMPANSFLSWFPEGGGAIPEACLDWSTLLHANLPHDDVMHGPDSA